MPEQGQSEVMKIANIVRGCLEPEGIDAWVLGEAAGLGNGGGVIAAQGIRVQVRACDAEEAIARPFSLSSFSLALERAYWRALSRQHESEEGGDGIE